ncbi:MAG: mannose-6-phosphate isomerase [Bacteroides sp.]|nr:mannose-6-phosphate isomerase [Bacteroides sp.]
MYPIKFNPILKSTLWGGEKIIPFKQLKGISQTQVGESWEISNVPGDESVVADGPDAGKNLSQLVKEHKGTLVGKENYERFGDNFPLLIKFIDACDDLSIQVHPDDALAKVRHNSMGKTEMWYVIDNNGGQAHLRSGLKKQITPDEYAAMIADNTICDALADYAVQPGDVFFLPAGRIHSIGAGCFIAEIQQTSNVTYRIYDFNRKDKNGNTRELHTELSKDAIDYHVEADYRTAYTPKQNEPVELVTCPYFTTSVYDLTENMTLDYSDLDSFVILICMEGRCILKTDEGHELTMQAGESVLLPATTGEVNLHVNEHVKFLETYV